MAKSGEFGLNTAVSEPGLAATGTVELTLKDTVDSVVKTGDGGEQSGLQTLAIFSQSGGVTRVVSNFAASHKGESSHDCLKGVRVGQVADKDIIAVSLEDAFNAGGRGTQVSVGKLDTLGITGGARGVAEHGAVVFGALIESNGRVEALLDDLAVFKKLDTDGTAGGDLLLRDAFVGHKARDGFGEAIFLHSDQLCDVFGSAENAAELSLVQDEVDGLVAHAVKETDGGAVEVHVRDVSLEPFPAVLGPDTHKRPFSIVAFGGSAQVVGGDSATDSLGDLLDLLEGFPGVVTEDGLALGIVLELSAGSEERLVGEKSDGALEVVESGVAVVDEARHALMVVPELLGGLYGDELAGVASLGGFVLTPLGVDYGAVDTVALSSCVYHLLF
jgi:hypothetical protein